MTRSAARRVPRAAAPDAPAEAVRAVAAAAPDWASLRAPALRCTACPELAATRTTVVFGQWPPGADVLLLGEAPGAEEDAAGEPFVGRSGRLLDGLLAEAGLPRESVAVVNVLKCRPPGNRRPQPVEALRCRGWLDRQLMFVDPLVLVPLGATATAAVLGRAAKVTAVRGRPRVAGDRFVVASYHPSAALRFGPRGEPLAALAADLAFVAGVAAALRAAGVRLAPAGPADAGPLREVTAAAYAGLPLDPPSSGPAGADGEVAEALVRDGGVVARLDGRVVGGLWFAAPDGDGAVRRVRRLAVRPELQGRGIGGALLRFAEAAAATDGCTELRLGVPAGLPAALPFCTARGYRPVPGARRTELVKELT